MLCYEHRYAWNLTAFCAVLCDYKMVPLLLSKEKRKEGKHFVMTLEFCPEFSSKVHWDYS